MHLRESFCQLINTMKCFIKELFKCMFMNSLWLCEQMMNPVMMKTYLFLTAPLTVSFSSRAGSQLYVCTSRWCNICKAASHGAEFRILLYIVLGSELPNFIHYCPGFLSNIFLPKYLCWIPLFETKILDLIFLISLWTDWNVTNMIFQNGASQLYFINRQF